MGGIGLVFMVVLFGVGLVICKVFRVGMFDRRAGDAWEGWLIKDCG